MSSATAPRLRTRSAARLALAGALGAAVCGGLALAPVGQATTAPKVHTLNAKANVSLARTATNGTAHYTGRATGTPFGAGRMALAGSLGAGRLAARFTLTTPRGVVRGTATAPIKVRNGRFSFAGTARITGATGTYRGARSVRINFAGNTASLRAFTFTLKGRVRY